MVKQHMHPYVGSFTEDSRNALWLFNRWSAKDNLPMASLGDESRFGVFVIEADEYDTAFFDKQPNFKIPSTSCVDQ